jgi:hypothetical protein
MQKLFRIARIATFSKTAGAQRAVSRCLPIAVVVVLTLAGRAAGVVNIWLSEIGPTAPGSAFPATPSELPTIEPFIGASESIYIWGRPDAEKKLANISLNLVADTPGVIQFTTAHLYNPSFGPDTMLRRRFEYEDDSSPFPLSDPPIPPMLIAPNGIEGIEGLTVLNDDDIPAVGVGDLADSLYDSMNNSWLIAEVTYNVLATGEGAETHLFLEIGPIGMNHTGESTAAHSVIFGDATDVVVTDVVVNGDHVKRGVHEGTYDAKIRPLLLPGDSDRNGKVEPADYDIWKANFGSATVLAADLNDNDIVDAADYIIWRDNLGVMAGAGAVSSIPEPYAPVPVLAALAALLVIRRTFRA